MARTWPAAVLACVTFAALGARTSAAWPEPALVAGFVTSRGVASVQGRPTARGLVLAREQAELRAHVQLLDLVGGADYRSSSTTETTPEGAVTQRRTSGTLQGARVLDERLLGGTTWEVVVGVPSAAPPPRPLPPPPPPPPPPPRLAPGPRTSIVVNARVAGARAASWRRVVTADGVQLYVRPDLTDRPAPTDLLAALSCDLAGDRPLIVHAIAVRGPSGEDVVLSEADAARVRVADLESEALARGAVVVVAKP